MKSSIPLLLLSFCWIASFGNCDRSYRVIEKIRNSGKHNQPAEQEQCMAEMRKACGASECCRKLFLLDESYAKSNKEHASKMEDKPQTSEERRREEEDVEEEEDESESSSFGDDYPKSAGKSPKSEDDDESDPVKQRKRKDCQKPKMRGPCLDALKRFYYSTKTRSCGMFIYGGCYGNHNNFVTKKECEETCMRQTKES